MVQDDDESRQEECDICLSPLPNVGTGSNNTKKGQRGAILGHRGWALILWAMIDAIFVPALSRACRSGAALCSGCFAAGEPRSLPILLAAVWPSGSLCAKPCAGTLPRFSEQPSSHSLTG